MKQLLLTTILGASLTLPQNSVVPPPSPFYMAGVPPASVQPEPVVLPVIPAAIVIGVGVGAIGWLGLKAINGILRIREHQLTNGAPGEVVFDYEGDDYPE